MHRGQIEDELSRKCSFMRVKFVERESLYNFAEINERKLDYGYHTRNRRTNNGHRRPPWRNNPRTAWYDTLIHRTACNLLHR